MTIEDIKRFSDSKNIMWTNHCLERMGERDISRADVKNCIFNGEIIEEYPKDFPNPTCLVFGLTLDEKVLHVVVGMDDKCLYVVTAYFPTDDKFEPDMKTRRK